MFLTVAYSRNGKNKSPDIERRIFYEKDAVGLARGLKESGKYFHVSVYRLHTKALWEWEDHWPVEIVRK